MKKIFVLALIMVSFAILTPAFADVVVSTPAATTTTTTTWRTVDTPIGSFFYLLGDIVASPFHLLGWLF